MDNKTLVTRLSAKLGKNRSDVSKLLEGFTSVVTSCAADLDAVAIPGFGSFDPVKIDEQVSINPDNGKRTLYPPKVEISFQASNILKKKININHV